MGSLPSAAASASESVETSGPSGDKDSLPWGSTPSPPAEPGERDPPWKSLALTFSSPAFLQKLCGVDPLAGDTGHRPHVYAEEGECERAESLSSLACSKPDS